MRLLLIFVGVFYVTFSSVAQSAVPGFVQSNIEQAVVLSIDDNNHYSLENPTASRHRVILITEIDNTKNTSRNGEEISYICMFHAIALETSICIEPATQKQIPILTRRLVALQPFSIKKPPRMTF